MKDGLAKLTVLFLVFVVSVALSLGILLKLHFNYLTERNELLLEQNELLRTRSELIEALCLELNKAILETKGSKTLTQVSFKECTRSVDY